VSNILSPTLKNFLTGVSFGDSSTGYVVGGSSTILKTTDAGVSWVPQTNPGGNFNDVSFLNANVGLTVGDGGTILWTTNGGSTWTNQNSGTTTGLTSAAILDANTAVVVGSGGTILRTTNEQLQRNNKSENIH